jgi:hypothetical protein
MTVSEYVEFCNFFLFCHCRAGFIWAKSNGFPSETTVLCAFHVISSAQKLIPHFLSFLLRRRWAGFWYTGLQRE